MGINGIGAAGYPMTGYVARKAEKNAESTEKGFMEIVTEKAEQEKKADYDEKAFESVGANAPEEVKQAWMEAAKEVSTNGLGMKKNGMLSHISQMMVQRCNKMMRGEADSQDILGNTVESAIRAMKQALYDLEHPRVYVPKSIEVQQAQVKEREFYTAFLEKLDALVK